MLNKKTLLILGIASLTLAGCQSMEDQIGAKLAEGLINTASNGEVKVSIDDLESGKFNVTTKEGTMSIDANDDSGTLKVTDNEGNTTTMSSGEGDTRPAEAAADLPSPANATDFSYFNSEGLTSVSYKLPVGDLKALCDNAKSLSEGAGWTKGTGFAFESEDNIGASYEKDGFTMMLSCSLVDGVPEIAMTKMPKAE